MNSFCFYASESYRLTRRHGSKDSAFQSGDVVRSLGWEDPMEKEMATHSSILPGNSTDRGTWRATVRRVTECLVTKQQQWQHESYI